MTNRRQFITQAAAAGMATSSVQAAESFPRGKAEACIFLWLGGGACHVDTWDPKLRGDGKKKSGSYYEAIPTAVREVKVCEHLSRTAPLLDRCVLLRTVAHTLQDHAAATNFLHTGRPTSGTIVYPSIGSLVTHQRGAQTGGVPPYVVMGYPNVTRGPGYLGAKYGYVYLTETEVGPTGFTPPAEVTRMRQARREALLAELRGEFLKRNAGDQAVQNYGAVNAAAFKLAGPQFMKAFDLASEPAALRDSYGGEFGQRCLLARRLVERGARFIEVAHNLNFLNGTGWDTHNEGQLKQHELIIELDKAFATLLTDLEQKRLLDRTLVVIATEFGRPPEFDAGGGRGHQPEAFTVVLAGAGLRTGRAIGATDEIGKKAVTPPLRVADVHATIHCALGINPAKELYAASRPVPITDRGEPVRELFG